MSGKVSVLMGIYNCASTLEQAVGAIKKQTYENWELILCDDGSTDKTYEIAQKLAKEDARIIVIRNDKNLGLNETLNKCLLVASGEFVARMDGDDDCPAERFEKQVTFLESQNEFDIVSSPMIFFDEQGEWGQSRVKEFPSAKDVVEGSPICHAPVMMRKRCMDMVGGYTVDSRMLRVEDVNLWIKLYAAGFRCYNIQDPLYRMRNDQDALERRKYQYRINSVYVRLCGCRELRLGFGSYLRAFQPMVVGLVPAQLRLKLRKKISGY